MSRLRIARVFFGRRSRGRYFCAQRAAHACRSLPDHTRKRCHGRCLQSAAAYRCKDAGHVGLSAWSPNVLDALESNLHGAERPVPEGCTRRQALHLGRRRQQCGTSGQSLRQLGVARLVFEGCAQRQALVLRDDGQHTRDRLPHHLTARGAPEPVRECTGWASMGAAATSAHSLWGEPPPAAPAPTAAHHLTLSRVIMHTLSTGWCYEHCGTAALTLTPQQMQARLPRCAHIFDSLLGAPPVTFATRRPPSSVFSSFSCACSTALLLSRSSCALSLAAHRAHTGGQRTALVHCCTGCAGSTAWLVSCSLCAASLVRCGAYTKRQLHCALVLATSSTLCAGKALTVGLLAASSLPSQHLADLAARLLVCFSAAAVQRIVHRP